MKSDPFAQTFSSISNVSTRLPHTTTVIVEREMTKILLHVTIMTSHRTRKRKQSSKGILHIHAYYSTY